MKTVADLKAYLSQFDEDMPVVLTADECENGEGDADDVIILEFFFEES